MMRVLCWRGNVYSSSGIVGSLRPDRSPGYGYVDSRRIAYLWDYHKLHDVLSGGARLLKPGTACIDKERALHRYYKRALCVWVYGIGYGRNKSNIQDLLWKDVEEFVHKALVPFVIAMLLNALPPSVLKIYESFSLLQSSEIETFVDIQVRGTK